MTPIYTYYTPLPNRSPEDEYRLILLWKKNWECAGFTPVVLNEWHARQHRLYERLSNRLATLPTVNLPEYERACYLRHLAYAQVGGGWCADYDVFCYGDVAKAIEGLKLPVSMLHILQQHVPSLMVGNAKAIERLILGIIDYKVDAKDTKEFGRPHVSDMHVLLNGGCQHHQHDLVKNYGENGWESSTFVHYSSGSMQKLMPKWKHIPTLR